MKRITLFFVCLSAALAAVSCNKDSGSSYDTQAVVTVKGDTGEQCYFQLDEGTVVIPENISTNPYGKEVRAFTLYLDKGETEPNGNSTMKYRRAQVQYIDSILTKKTAANLGEDENNRVYGTDPIDIYRSWMTVVEDGYITLRFCARWGTSTVAADRVHTINLVRDTDSSDPYLFELRHNYCNDISAPYGYFRDGTIAFNIKDILARESKSTYDIKLKYISEYGLKTVTFHYTPGTSCGLGTSEGSSNSEGFFE